MYLTDALNLLLRRWYIVLVGIVVLAVAVVGVVNSVPTTYQASGQTLFLPPTAIVEEDLPDNPYLSLPGGLTLTATLVASTLNTPDVQREVAAEGYTASFAVAVPPLAGPIIVVTVEDTDPAGAIALRDELMFRIRDTLASLQTSEGTPESLQMVPREFNVSSQAEVLAGSKVRALAVIGIVIGILTLVATFGIDRLAGRRQDRKERRRLERDEARLEIEDVESTATHRPDGDDEPAGHRRHASSGMR